MKSFFNLKIDTTSEDVYLSGYEFDSKELRELSKKLENNRIRTLDLSNNSLPDKSLNLIFKSLQKNKNLESLDLTETRLSSKGIKLLSDTLKKHPSLATVDLSENEIHDQSLEYFFKALKKNTILENLYLIDCSIGNKGSELIGNYLSGKDQKLIRLDISTNFNINANHIFNSLKNNKTLKVLKVSDISLKDSVDSLVDLIKKNDTLIQLTLNNCSLDQYDKFFLMSAVQNNPTLRILHLQGNSIFTYHGPKHEEYDDLDLDIGPFISKNKTLKVLNLADCEFDQHVLCSILESLKENNTLEVLNLSKTVRYYSKNNIFESLKFNKTLKSLYLNEINFSPEILQYLLESIEENDTLELLSLSGNSLQNESCEPISKMLSKNQKLVELNLEKNWMDEKGLELILEGLQFNTTLVVLNVKNLYPHGDHAIAAKDLFNYFSNIRNLEVFESSTMDMKHIMNMNTTCKEIKNNFSEMEKVQKISDISFQFKYIGYKRTLDNSNQEGE
eukprot:gene5607-9424_t